MGMMGGDASAMDMNSNMMGGMDPNMMGGIDPNMMGDVPDGNDPNAQQPLMNNQDMQQGNDGFDMGIGMTPDEDPKKWLQGAATKLASELRKYQQSQPSPDIEIDKTAVNTIAAATKDNLDNGQKNELMTSYADTMRDDNNSDDNDNNFDDYNQDSDDMNNQNMEGNQNDGEMSYDPNMQVDDQSTQQMMENKIIKTVTEMLINNLNKRKDKTINSKVKSKPKSYSCSPYKATPNKK